MYYSNGNENHVSHIWSVDGENWSSPDRILDISSRYNDIAPRLAIDERNRLHVVVGEMGTGTAVYYSQSSDNGQSWSYPLVIDSRDSRFYGDYGPAWINVITRGSDEVHLVWDGAPSGQRWHQWSDDGGNTWQKPEQISSEVRGLTGSNALGVDGTGRLHLFSMGITGSAPYYASWWNGSWSSMDPIASQGWDGEGPTLAIAGNSLVVAWWNCNQDTVEIWTSMKKINAPNILPKPQATNEMNVTTTLEPLRNPITTETTAKYSTGTISTEKSPSNAQQSTSNQITLILLTGSLPAIALFVIILFRRRYNNN